MGMGPKLVHFIGGEFTWKKENLWFLEERGKREARPRVERGTTRSAIACSNH